MKNNSETKNKNKNKSEMKTKIKMKIKNSKNSKNSENIKTKMKNAKKLKDNVIKMEDNEMEMHMDMEMANLSHKTNKGKVDFDKILMECLKNNDLLTSGMNKNEKNRLNKNYENSFQEIMTFRENVSKEDIQQIDTIIFHAENNDGAFSASIAYHYFMTVLYKNDINKQNNFQIIPDKPRSEVKRIQNRNIDKLRGRNVLILDIEYHPSYIQHLQEICANVFMIDDHMSSIKLASNKLFIGTNHAVCANTFKFFYPNEPLPPVIKMIDISDSKIKLGNYSNYMNLFTLFIGHRYTHNKRAKKDMKQMLTDIWNQVIETESVNSFIVAGHYMDEVQESLKEQIAINAKPAKFQGYNVAVLNFNAPAIKKMVGRQINTNYERMGQKIDFAVVWGYEYTSNSYDITLIDNHRPESNIELGDIAKKLGKIGGHPRGGGGHQHESHFYWPRIPGKQDIWDLFTKQYI